MSTTENEEWQNYRPGSEPYLGVRILELLPPVFGSRGVFVVGLYSYLRWVDNVIDEEPAPAPDRNGFLKRQISLVRGEAFQSYSPMESHFRALPWQDVPEQPVRQRVSMILSTVADDLEHQGLVQRAPWENRHHDWRVILSVVEGLFLVLNERPIKPTARFMGLLEGYMGAGNLDDLGEDLIQGQLHFLMAWPPKEFSGQDVLGKIGAEEFQQLKRYYLNKMWKNLGSVFNLDIPLWQKVASFIYLTEAALKKELLLSRKRALSCVH